MNRGRESVVEEFDRFVPDWHTKRYFFFSDHTVWVWL